ncbi:MAG: hypothetical protein AUK47_22675 [Deltaproteobacteria bacterium CG2_30_63_29]|nr:MAG: hypothetical protein AUK47_22675 [Deltaproteobacteria bacterium CG2_30_63_29]
MQRSFGIVRLLKQNHFFDSCSASTLYAGGDISKILGSDSGVSEIDNYAFSLTSLFGNCRDDPIGICCFG